MRDEKQEKFWRRMAGGQMGLKKINKRESSVAKVKSKHFAVDKDLK